MGGQLKLSNVLGAPFRPFVRAQLSARVAHSLSGGGLLNGDMLRTSDDVLNLANQLAWVKLSSSVKATPEYLTYLQNQFADSGDGDAFITQEWTANGLARNWILAGGTSKDQATKEYVESFFAGKAGEFKGRKTATTLREGIGNDGAYGLGGPRAQGYRPMPGITSMQVKSAGRLGSLRYATIDFKVWNRNQLDIIDTLYLRLGYTMLLEWGHVNYFETDTSTALITDNYGIGDFFIPGQTKDDIQYSVNRQVTDSNGNYDGMLGVVCNFDCSFNQEGGWDCSIKLIGLGSIMESQKINLSYTMPPDVKMAWDEIKRRYRAARKKEIDDANAILNKAAYGAYAAGVGAQQADWDKSHPIRSLKTLAQSIGEHTKAKKDTDADLKNILDSAKISTVDGVNLATEFYYFNNPTPLPTNANVNETVLYKGQTPATTDPTETILPDLSPIKAGTAFTYDFGPLNNAAVNGVIGVRIPATTNRKPIPGTFQNQPLAARLKALKASKSYKNAGVASVIDLALQKSGITQTVVVGLLETRPLLVGGSDGVGFTDTDNYVSTTSISGLFDSTTLPSTGTIINLDDVRSNRPSTFITITKTNGQIYRVKLSVLNTTTATTRGLFGKTIEQWSGFWKDDWYYSGIKATDFVEILETQINNITAFTVDEVDGVKFTTETANGVAYTKAIIKATQSGPFAVQPATLYSPPSFLDRFRGIAQFDLVSAALRVLKGASVKETTIDIGLVFQLETEILTPIKVTAQQSARPPLLGAGAAGTYTPPDYFGIDIELANMSLGLGSALEAMLTVIKYDAITKCNDKGPLVQTRDQTDLTGKFLTYGSGSLPPMAPLFVKSGNSYVLNIDQTVQNKDTVAAYPFLKNVTGDDLLKDPTSTGVKGYATTLMQDYNRLPATSTTKSTPLERWEQIPSVNFQAMMNSYLIRKHILSSTLDKPSYKNEYPVYIKLAYLLFFINNQSLLYDTTRKSKASAGQNISRPIFYIDYNPETNICSTTPSQLSIDPQVAMIPYQGNTDDYKALFINNVVPDGDYFTEGKALNKLPIGTATAIKNSLPPFKNTFQNQGRTMDILLNIDYLLGLIKSTVDRDNHNNVYLQAFLERIVTDLNKSFGDLNAFRVGYNDAGNTVQITDDQYAPSLPTEVDSLFALRNELTTKNQLFQIPVFEEASLARSFSLKSDASTKMSRAIAIGAQAANSGSVQSVDASTYHWLNNGLTDRFITTKQNATQLAAPAASLQNTNNTGKTKKGKKGQKKKAAGKAVSTPAQEDPNKVLATKFNTHVINIYSTGDSIYTENIDTSKNFLIQGATKAKAEDESTYGSLSIPYNASLTISGISGIMMGNAFLLPDKILPLSIRGTKAQTRFGFYVMGLDHSLDANQWVTNIRGQIVRIRENKNKPVAASTGAAPTGQNYQDALADLKSQMTPAFIAYLSHQQGDAGISAILYYTFKDPQPVVPQNNISNNSRIQSFMLNNINDRDFKKRVGNVPQTPENYLRYQLSAYNDNYTSGQQKKKYDKLFNELSKKYDVPLDIIKAACETESRFDPTVRSINKDGTPGPYYGLFQLGTTEFLTYNPKATVASIFDPAKNANAGVQLLKGYLQRAQTKIDKYVL